MPRVFISYSHDDDKHKEWVLQVSQELRTKGLDCQIDQYINGFPSEGWPLWMEKEIDHADYVLVICSDLYLKRYRREDAESGRGVAFEGAIITQALYDHHGRNEKFIPVIPESGHIDHVPISLKSSTVYRLPQDYNQLYRLLTDQPAVIPADVGSIKDMPQKSVLDGTHSTPTNNQTDTPLFQPVPPLTPESAHKVSYGPHNSAFLVPFRTKGKFLVGRETALEKVRQQLLTGKPTRMGQTALLQGIGGLGKTQLAVEYANKYREAYPNGVYWITADENIDAQLTQLAVDANWVAPASEHSIKLDIARHRLKTYSDCLIVFDNLESMDAIHNYLPVSSANPHILVTSRREQPDFTDIELELLDDELSYVMLIQEARSQPQNASEKSAARKIAATLDGLPLALELAGAFIARRHIGWCAYRDLLLDDLKQALPTELSSLTGHEADLFKTLKISEQEIGEEPLLAHVLDLLTWSGSSPMSLPLMAHLLDVRQTDLRRALGLGVALRLLQQVPDSERYSLHRLVQEVRRKENPLAQRVDWTNIIAQRLGDWFEAIRNDFSELPLYELEFEHLKAWQIHAEVFSAIVSARLLWLQAYPAYHRGYYNEAYGIVQRTWVAYEAHSLSTSPLNAHLLNDLASCSSNLGNYSRALGLCERALKMRRELFGDKHPDIAISLANLASYHGDLGDYSHALELDEQALKMRRELFGDQHPNIATSLGNLASYHCYLGDYSRALELGEQALKMRRELFGDQHPDIAISLGNLASCHCNLGDYSRALELGEQALKMRRELFDDKHPNIATSLNNLANYHGDLGDYSRALELGEQALKMRREIFGDKHPYIATSLSNLASYHGNLGDYSRALELGKQALEMQREIFGDKHPDTLNYLRFVAKMQFNNPFTAKQGEELIKEFIKHIPHDHPSHAKALNILNSRKGFRKQGKIGSSKKRKKK